MTYVGNKKPEIFSLVQSDWDETTILLTLLKSTDFKCCDDLNSTTTD